MNNLCVVTNTERATKTFMLNDWFLWKRPERKESYWRCNIKEFETFSVNDNWFPWLKILCDIHIVSTSQMQSKETDFFLSRLQPGCEIRELVFFRAMQDGGRGLEHTCKGRMRFFRRTDYVDS